MTEPYYADDLVTSHAPPMNWYDDRANLARVAHYMGDQGDSAENIAYMLEKPWKYEDEWRRSNLRSVSK